jgi:membrane protease YdiL (CAAX protease family)
MAASMLLYWEHDADAVIRLLKRSLDYERIKAKTWYMAIIFVMPCATLLSYGIMRFMGFPLTAPSFHLSVALVMIAVFFLAALAEELGWMGYAMDVMQERFNALEASLILGIIWAAWHWIPLVQAGRSVTWIAWWSVYTVALRVLIVWLYKNTGKSVFAAALFHTMTNVSSIIFSGYYDPRITGLIMSLTATAVTVIWRGRMLVRPTCSSTIAKTTTAK